MTFFILRATFQRCIENIGDLDSSVGNKKGWCFLIALFCAKTSWIVDQAIAFLCKSWLGCRC
jgi:hypothetical protein